MIVHEFLEKHAIDIVGIGDSAGAPLHMLMPNGHPELDRDSFFLEQMFAIDALEQVHVCPRQIAFLRKTPEPHRRGCHSCQRRRDESGYG